MAMRTALMLSCMTLALIGCAGSNDEHRAPPTTQQVDLQRYQGTWYEQARLPNSFQRECAGDVQANYVMEADKTITVTNRCQGTDGEVKEAIGQGRLSSSMEPADPAILEVRFAPKWLSWFPMVWGDYWVIDLDPDYQLVAVSEPAREYLWVLSRTPVVDAQAYEALLARLAARGFDPGKLERTLQQGK